MKLIYWMIIFLLFNMAICLMVNSYLYLSKVKVKQSVLSITDQKIENYKKMKNWMGKLGICSVYFYTVIYCPMIEEIIFRGYLYRVFRLWFPCYIAIILGSLIFAFLHFNRANRGNLVIVIVCFLHSIFFGIANHHGNILYAITLHSIANLISYLPIR